MQRLPIEKPTLTQWSNAQYILDLVSKYESTCGAFQLVPPPGVAAHNTSIFRDTLTSVQLRPSVVHTQNAHHFQVSYEKKHQTQTSSVEEYFTSQSAPSTSLGPNDVFDAAHSFRTTTSAPLLYADSVSPTLDQQQQLFTMVPPVLKPKSRHDFCSLIKHELLGLTTPYGFIGIWATGTGWHDEDDGSASLHIVLEGRKLWYFVPRTERPKLDAALAELGLSFSRLAFVSPLFLLERGIHVYYADHSVAQGSIIVSVGAFHQVLNVSPCIGYAWNLYFDSMLSNTVAMMHERYQSPKRHESMKIPLQEMLFRSSTFVNARTVYQLLVKEEQGHRKAFERHFPDIHCVADAPRGYDPWYPYECTHCHNRTTSWSVVNTKDARGKAFKYCLACIVALRDPDVTVTGCYYLRTMFSLRERLAQNEEDQLADVPISSLLAWTFYSQISAGPILTRGLLVAASKSRLSKQYGWEEKEYERWFHWLAGRGFGRTSFTATRKVQLIKTLEPEHELFFHEYRMDWTRVREFAEPSDTRGTHSGKRARQT